MKRQFPHSGRWRPRSPAEAVPLLVDQPKSPPHVRAAQTRKERDRARILAKAEELRLEVAMQRGWLI